ncbi:unnamed protein product [Haemonchus placei]|uniref:Dimer_Tnp_hAT domain-containing protein n=1 Tax=Haemonchus placei TaxID=6290 RepID=A0A0N4WJY7_HAEPC|nr:unnamed protein product [Haemonchus placei]
MGKYSEYFLVHENMLICNTCSWAIPKPKDCTTSSLLHHLRKKHPDLYSSFKDREDRTKYERATAAERALALAHGLKRIWKSEPEAGPEPSQPKRPNCKAGSSFASEATIWEPPHRERMDNIEKAITQLLCTATLPPSFVESPGFRNLITVISPRFHLKPRVHFTENSLSALYEEYTTKIRTMLNSALFVSFSTDVRALPNSDELLLTFTIHFIDDRMVPRFATVSANLIRELPTPDETRALLAKALNSFVISQEKVHILVEHWPIPSVTTASYVKHMSDFSQKLQKAIDEGLKLVLNGNDSFFAQMKQIAPKVWKGDMEKRFRNCSRLCRISTGASGNRMCWNCLYVLLCRLLEQKNSLAFVLVEANSDKSPLDSSQWERIREIVDVLKPIDFAIGLVKHRHFTPISVVIPLYKVIVRQLREDTTSLSDVREAICVALEESMAGCEDQDELYLATLVDPRFRAAYFAGDKRQEFLEKLEEMAFLPVENPAQGAEANVEDCSNPFVAFRKFEPPSITTPSNLSKIEAGTRALSELEDYLSHDPSFVTDPYEFWQNDVNSAKYPLTKKLALKYLSAPGISMDCQSLLSRLESINSGLHSSWEPDELEKVLFLHHNILTFGF